MGWLTFLNPAFLWGALAASIPVIIHLINRRRARVVQFPTVKFVLRSERRVARKYQVKQWLLLALRTLILFLLTTALAEPVLHPSVGELAELADGEVRPQDHGVVLPLVSTDAPPQALSGDRAGLMQQVSDLAHTFQPGGFVLPFQRAYALLKTSEAPKKEIIVITDHTRTPWVGFEPATLKMIDPQVRVTVTAKGRLRSPAMACPLTMSSTSASPSEKRCGCCWSMVTRGQRWWPARPFIW